jgi:hypothetical protein
MTLMDVYRWQADVRIVTLEGQVRGRGEGVDAAGAEAAVAASLSGSSVLSRTEAPVKFVPDTTTGPAAAASMMPRAHPCAGSAVPVS